MGHSRIIALRIGLGLLLGLWFSLPLHAAIISSEADAGTRAGSRLRHDDRILIWPQAIDSPNGALSSNIAQCVSLYNRSRVDYFVPWKSDSEWQAFLAARSSGQLNTSFGTVDAGRCCPPQLVQICGTSIPSAPGVAPEYDTNLGQRSVAAREIPANPNDLEHYGAPLDVKALQSSIVLGNNLINYEVTYMCNADGSWTKTREVGSCIPVDGACNSQYTAAPIAELPPQSQWETKLCAEGSVLHDPSGNGSGPFVTGSGPWQWQCDGTPGRASVQCTAEFDGCNSTIIPAGGFNRLPNDINSLCRAGYSVTNLVPQVGSGPWDWQCRKNDGSHISSCHAGYDPSMNGLCNPAFAGQIQSVVPLAKTGLCLGFDGITPIDSTYDPDWEDTTIAWRCPGFGPNGGDVACTAPIGYYNGECGSLSSMTPIDRPADNDPGLCSVGTPSPVTVAYFHQDYFFWTCTGIQSPFSSDTFCTALRNDRPIVGTCGVVNKTTITTNNVPDPTTAGYCATGTATKISHVTQTNGGQVWTWVCSGSNGGADSSQCSVGYYPDFKGAACGTAHGKSLASMPASDALCGAGNTATQPEATASPVGWRWRCDDTLYPGKPTVCSAKNTVQPINGACGTAHNKTLGNFVKPPSASELCQAGGAVIGLQWPSDGLSTATIRWGCDGQNGGNATAINACSATYVPPVDGACGAAKNWTPNDISIIQSTPAFNLCLPAGESKPSNIVAKYDTTNPANSRITWTCSKVSSTGKDANCSALYRPTPKDGQCGAITATSIVKQPSATELCTVGTPYNWTGPVAGSGPGTMRWACRGEFGGDAASCQQTGIDVVDPNGQCGRANAAYVPDRPNYNLCAEGGGTASAVTGEGPWRWTCGVNRVPCQAMPCTICSGSIDAAYSGILVGSEETEEFDGCRARGQPIWSAQADLQIDNDRPVRLGWRDDFSGHTQINVTPAPAPPQYCAPCYMKPTRLLPGQTGSLIRRIGGNCPNGITSDPAILSGRDLTP